MVIEKKGDEREKKKMERKNAEKILLWILMVVLVLLPFVFAAEGPIGTISNITSNATMLNKSLVDPSLTMNISDDVYSYVEKGLNGWGWIYARNITTDELIDEFAFYGAHGELEEVRW